ncbi:MAG TPA: FecR domain-containing protein [Steroidobacteraceae bacterium]|nr:FecR domain-containing protein [Steroidobacteraceae bacterium]
MSRGIEPERLEQAAAWRARLAESADLHGVEFSAWLAQDPRNREAWRCVQAPWDVLGQQATAPGVIQLRRAALVHAHDAIRGNLRWPKRFRRPAMLAAAAAAVLAAGAFLFWQQHRPDMFRTGFGERRVVTLADGSQITLDSRSEVRVRYTTDSRSLTLVRGQARFDVAHDVTRPFSVTAEGHKVVATGTAFDVDLLGPKLLVTLLKGHVVVLPRSAPTIPWIPDATSAGSGSTTPAGAESLAASAAGDAMGRIYLDPGEQLVMSPSDAPRVSHVDIERVTAWERGEIVFDNEPLASVVQRMNRYGPRHIIIGDDRAGSMRISGVFHEGDVDGFVSTISAYLAVRAHERPDGDVVLIYHTASPAREAGS